MTKTMQPPLAVFDWGSVATPLVTLLLGGGGGGVLMAWLDRRSKRDEAARQDRRMDRKDDATVEIAKVQAKAELESQYFTALENERTRTTQLIDGLRTELDNSKRTLGHEIRGLRNALSLTQEVYHQLWTACTMLAMQCRIMRARIKRTEGDHFDESEFPMIEVEVFDPKKLFSQFAANLSPEPDTRKLTGRIVLEPDQKS